MAKAQIENRDPVTGFVYTKNTRMLFAPKHCATRNEADRELRDLVITCAARWPEPTEQDVGEIRDALAEAYPDRRLFVDTAEGLVPVHEPTPS